LVQPAHFVSANFVFGEITAVIARCAEPMSKPSRIPLPLAAWIFFCAFLNCAGWILSALRRLDASGYAIILAIGVIFVWFIRKKFRAYQGWNLAGIRRRSRRLFPLAFFVLASLAILGGLLHAPGNYDALAYRLPRMLNWLADGHWHWVHTDFQRLNTRSCGIEWISTPLIAFTKTDRFLFLINTASFLLLPGLVFSTLARLGVKPRVAWHWMWLIPSGYCYLLQAGSVSNDMFGAVFALAAVDFALRARQSGRVSEVCLSVLAAALMTSAKASNLPLLLPWVVAFFPTWRIWLRHPVAMATVAFPALWASIVPTAILNQVNCGDWTGLAAEHAIIGSGPAWLHLLNNSINYLLENLCPPVFPFAQAWNHFADRIIPPSLATLLQKYFEPGAAHWWLGEMQIEEGAGLGFGVTVLLFLSLIAAAVRRIFRPKSVVPSRSIPWLVCLAPWASLLYVMSKLGLSGAARYLAPYYLLLLPALLLAAAHSDLIKRTWWRLGAFIVFALALMLVIISPERPLWPAGWVLQHYGARLEASHLGSRAVAVYGVYARRANAFAPAIAILPPDATLVGIVTRDDPETSLWRPFGSRRIVHVRADEAIDEIQQRGIKYILVKTDLLHEPWDQWLQRVHGRLLDSLDLRLRAGDGPSTWRLVQLEPPVAAVAP
jgi:hypothetical protein